MAKENPIYPDKAFQRGLREIKVKDLPEVREAVKDILGVKTDQSFRNYAGGKVATLDINKAMQIAALFESYGVTNPWGL